MTGNRLRQLRESLALEPVVMANLIGVDADMYRAWERRGTRAAGHQEDDLLLLCLSKTDADREAWAVVGELVKTEFFLRGWRAARRVLVHWVLDRRVAA